MCVCVGECVFVLVSVCVCVDECMFVRLCMFCVCTYACGACTQCVVYGGIDDGNKVSSSA